jgi:hypothetical protein
MSKIQNISIETKKVSIYLDKISTKSRLPTNISKNLDLSWQSRFVSTISINISTKINLNQKISILKISTEKKKVDLDMMDILNGFQKLVSTWRTISISILIGLNFRDPHG